jgi:Ser/Thr protein kinase RdoA (MazF antagonist)
MMMRAFETLEYDAQVERLDRLARRAISAYSLPDATATLHAYTNNAVYSVVDHSASFVKEARYALRITRPDNKRLAWIRSELAWLSAIRRNTWLEVPEPAGHVYTGELEGVDSPVYGSLFGWVDGESKAQSEVSLEQIETIGEFAAMLHNFSETFEPPAEFDRPRLDWEGLFGDDSPYRTESEDEHFTDEHRKTIQEAAAYVQSAMDNLGQASSEFGMIHGDLLPKNILFRDDQVCALDFDDCAYGYYIYDLSPLLWGYRDDARYPQIKAALWDGYTGVRELDDDHREALEAFIAARHIASCRWIAGNANHPDIRGKARDIINTRIDELRQYLTEGVLR